MTHQIFVATEITPETKKKLDEYREKTGITQVAMVSQLVHWFASQTDLVQYLLLDLLPPEGRRAAIKLTLQNLQTPSKSQVSKPKLLK